MQPITTLADLIAQVESNGNSHAMRFESAYMPRDPDVITMMSLNKCSKITAEILCKMSYGLFQIMGDNLISLGLSTDIFNYVSSIAMQKQMFIRYCIRNNCEYTLEDVVNDETKRIDFARKYNGPGNAQTYADRMVAIFKESLK